MPLPFAGELSALLTAALWAMSSFLIAAISSRIGPVQTNIGRMVVAMFFFLVTIRLFHLPLSLSSAQMKYLVLSAVVGIVFGDTFLFKAFQQIGARISMLIMSISPAIAAILAYIFLGETLSFLGMIGMIITLLGITIVVSEKKQPDHSQYRVTAFGIFCAFLGALGQGGGVVLVKFAFLEGPIHGMVAAFIRISVSVLLLVSMTVLWKQFRNPLPILRQERKVALSLLLVAFFGTFLGVTLSLLAVAYAKVAIASTLIATSPVFMLPLARLTYKEHLSWKAVSGAFLAVGGVAMLFLI